MAAVLSVLALLTASVARAQKQCAGAGNDYLSIEIGDYMYYQTDVWHSNALSSGWWECIYFQNGQKIVEYTLWPSTYGDNSVKAYPSIVAGWNFGVGYKYGYGAGGLPFAVSDQKTVMTTWDIQHQNWNNDGDKYEAYDCAYDIWLSDDPNLSANGTPGLEFMVFLRAINTSPAGTVVDTASNICGTNWKIYKGNGGTAAPLWSWILDDASYQLNNCNLNELLQYMQQHHAGVLPSYVIGIQAGQEINQGTGMFNNTRFTLSIT